MKMRHLPTYLLTAVMAIVFCSPLGAQQRVRVAGLENDAEYCGLVAEEERLAQMSDSITGVMNDVRRSFRADTLNRAANSAALLRMEGEIFDIRDRMARLAGRINAIEQQCILKSLDTGELPPGTAFPPAAGTGERTVANLVYNPRFSRELSPDDYRELRNAQEMERAVPGLIERYRENNRTLDRLRRAYDMADGAETARRVKAQYDSVAEINSGLEREIAHTWGTVFDSKSYSYSFLMDKNNRNDMLSRFEEGMETLRRQQAEWQGVYASDEIAAYALQKRFLVGYEAMLAEELAIPEAADSLKKAQASVPRIDMLGIEPVKLRERLFLDYSEITVNPSSPYNSRNPIPEVEVYPKGIIYRVLLGTFSAPQQPSAFRNVSPLAVQKGPDGKYRYFAGGFPSDSTANDAVEKMRRRGFRKPEAVVWMDGVYMNLDTGKSLGSGFFRVELSGVGELSPEVKEVIRTVTGGRDIVRGGDMFIIGPLDNAPEAARLRSALEGRDPDMEIKISEIPE